MHLKPHSSHPPLAALAVIAACLLFLLLGCAFIPLAGVQNDEALFATPIFRPEFTFFGLKIGATRVPLMLMNYLGTLKTWIFTPVFALWAPSVWSLRVPVLLFATLTIWLLYLLTRDAAGRPAAVVAALLLATDGIYLLTSVFDWGPVALHHLLLTSAALLVLRFHRSAQRPLLFAGFLCLGLGLWDKALFTWSLGGLVLATLAVYPRELFRAARSRSNLAAAMAGFLLGAWPVVYYNAKTAGNTYRSTVALSTEAFIPKAQLIGETLNSSMMFGYFSGEDGQPMPRPAPSWSEALSRATGQPQRDLMAVAFVAALALTPLLWGTALFRPAMFAMLFLAAAWLQMILTRNAGGSVHHLVLPWPFPHFLIGVAFAGAAARLGRRGPAILAAAAAFLCVTNLLVIHQHSVQLRRNGAYAAWSDATLALASKLPSIPAERYVVVDWGLLDNTILLQQGRLPLFHAFELSTQQELTDMTRKALQQLTSNPRIVFIAWVDGREQFPNANATFEKHAAGAGFTKQLLATIDDRNGRPAIQVYRLAHAPSGAQ